MSINDDTQSGKIRILVIGAGRNGSRVIRQLMKNPEITIITLDSRENPEALSEGLVPNIDYICELNPRDIGEVTEEVNPDLILVTTSGEDIGHTGVPGLDILVDGLQSELEATSSVPVIATARK